MTVLKKTGTLDKLIRKLEEIGSADDVIITARTIQIVTGSLNKIVFVVPKLCERMLSFVNEHRNNISGDTVSYLLFYLFSMGYEPYKDSSQSLSTEEPKGQYLNAELFDFDNFIRIIDRDFEFLPAWLIVQACLALSFYQVCFWFKKNNQFVKSHLCYFFLSGFNIRFDKSSVQHRFRYTLRKRVVFYV